METRTETKQTTELPAEAAPANIVRITDVQAELAMTQQAELVAKSLMERLASIPDGAQIFKRRAEMIEACYTAALRRTRPQDWVLFKDQSGSVNAMLTASGAPLVAELYGIVIQAVRPVDDRGMFAPERIDYENGAYAYRGACDCWSRFNGRSLQGLEAARRSDEDFTGRSVDADGHLVKGRRPEDGEALDSDLRSAVLTALQTKAVRVLAGMTRVPVAELAAAWKGTDKKTEDCRKGSGFGSSSERGAEGVTDSDVRAEAKKLGDEIMRRVGGDQVAAKQLLVELTENPKKDFRGFDSIARMTKAWQIEEAWKRLRAHKVFGDQREQGREPGEGE